VTTSDRLTQASDEQLADRLARLQQRRPSAPTAGVGSSRPSPIRRRRHHPAARARVAALLLTLATTGGLGVVFADLNAARAGTQPIAGLPAPITVGGTPPPSASGGASAVAPTPQGFDGPVITTKYGPVQVQAQIANGAITDVAVIAYPDRDNKSRNINASALPQLRTEVLTAQSANVHSVSGATYTSTAYVQSLQAAIDTAHAAGATTIA
jgi:uncharacterized protein with FMN-binding domain